MAIKATIMIDDDRWAKHPYGVKFDDEECNREFYTISAYYHEKLRSGARVGIKITFQIVSLKIEKSSSKNRFLCSRKHSQFSPIGSGFLNLWTWSITQSKNFPL